MSLTILAKVQLGFLYYNIYSVRDFDSECINPYPGTIQLYTNGRLLDSTILLKSRAHSMTSFQRDLVLVLPRIFGISGTLLKRPSIVQFDPCGPSTFDLTQKLYSNFISSFPTYAVVFNFIFFPTRAFFPTSFQVFQLQTFLAVYFTIYSNFCVVSV